MADEKTFRTMPTHFLLTSEVRRPEDLEHADVLLGTHPKAAAALDMLLGTQGWRRFAEQNVRPASPIDREEVERMLVAHGQRAAAPLDRFRLEEERVAAEYLPKLDQSAMRVREARAASQTFRTPEAPNIRARQQSLESQVKALEKQHSAAKAELYNFETRDAHVRSFALTGLLLGLLAL